MIYKFKLEGDQSTLFLFCPYIKTTSHRFRECFRRDKSHPSHVKSISILALLRIEFINDTLLHSQAIISDPGNQVAKLSIAIIRRSVVIFIGLMEDIDGDCTSLSAELHRVRNHIEENGPK